MKILFYIESLQSGGKERRLVELIKGLSKYPDYEIELVVTQNDIHYKDILPSVNKIHFTLRKRGEKDFSVFYKFYKIAKKFKPNIIHVWGRVVAIYAIPAKVILRIPMINNEITDAPSRITRGLMSRKLSFFFSDLLIANSFAGIKTYKPPKRKSFVIYNGFDFSRINDLQDKDVVKKRNKISTKYVIGMVASFSDSKDYTTYILAANSILNKRSDITFLCIGSGEYSKYEAMLEIKNRDNVVFLDRQKDVENIMNICDIGILTTNIKIHGEGISNALLEFSALGKPIVASAGGGTSEIIEEGQNGYLLVPFNVDDLCKKIEFLLDNNDVRIIMGKKANTIVKGKFGIERMVKEFIISYSQVYK
ncbi:MAG: glycosyltransferase [Ignavibacteria bacterium]